MSGIDLFTALILGLAGSLHCAGMCGPIAIALPLHKATFHGKIGRTFFYNTGRCVTYALMGFVFGLFGKGLVLAGLQQMLSIAVGSIMVISVILPILFRSITIYDKIYSQFLSRLFTSFRKQFSIDTYPSFLFIGLLNGLLPCGLVYIALAGAIATGNPLTGTLFMLIFGVGTIPVMMGLSLAGSSFGSVFKHRLNKIIPYIIVVIGLLFILRGLNLGIKYISPKEEKLQLKHNREHIQTNDNCH